MKLKEAPSLSILPALLLLASVATHVTRADAPAPAASQSQYEVRFITGMIDHHAMAVMTGMMCEERAIHEEMCSEIVATQTAEIELMQSWLQEWYGITHEPMMKPGHEKQMQKLALSNYDVGAIFIAAENSLKYAQDNPTRRFPGS